MKRSSPFTIKDLVIHTIGLGVGILTVLTLLRVLHVGVVVLILLITWVIIRLWEARLRG